MSKFELKQQLAERLQKLTGYDRWPALLDDCTLDAMRPALEFFASAPHEDDDEDEVEEIAPRDTRPSLEPGVSYLGTITSVEPTGGREVARLRFLLDGIDEDTHRIRLHDEATAHRWRDLSAIFGKENLSGSLNGRKPSEYQDTLTRWNAVLAGKRVRFRFNLNAQGFALVHDYEAVDSQ